MHRQMAFAFPQQDYVGQPLYVTLVGLDWTEADQTYSYRRERVEHYAFEYVTKGALRVEAGGTSHLAQQGDVYILHRGKRIHVQQGGETAWAKLWIVADGTLLGSLLSVYHLDDVTCVKACPVRRLFEKAYRLARASRDRRACQQQLAAVLYEIILGLAAVVAQRASPLSQEVLKARDYLDNHVGGRVSMDELGAVVGLSPAHTMRLFKQQLSVTPYAYLLRRKILEAQALLRHTRLSIKEISYRLGFCDEFHFSNSFKAKTGQSPSCYRQGE